MRWRLSIPRLAAIVWAAWLGLMGLMFGMWRLRVPHPHFLPIMALLVTLAAASLALILAGAWRVVRGPGRGRALFWLLLGWAPLWVLGGHMMYGLQMGYGRHFQLALPLKMLVPLGESAMDLLARLVYPQRTVSRKVTMISTRQPDDRNQVAAMDRHVERLEARLGRTMPGRAHWVRGPLVGLSGRALYGLCLGSVPGAERAGEDGLATLDRHEVAHCVISLLADAGSEPPAVLIEGWAEANCGQDPELLALRAWEARREGRKLSLRELTGPRWVGRHEHPVYVHGGPLVDTILRRFGPERFLALYTTSRRTTFAADCRRILGVSLDALDAMYWADIERTVARDGRPEWVRLRRLRIGPAVDPSAWTAFLFEYFAAAARVLAPFEQVRLTIAGTFTSVDHDGSEETTRDESRLIRSGGFRALRHTHPEVENAILAHPAHSLRAHRPSRIGPWQIEDDPDRAPADAYRAALSSADREHPTSVRGLGLIGLAQELGDRVDEGAIVVSRFERFTRDGHHWVRIGAEDQTPGDNVPWRSVSLLLDADREFVDREATCVMSDGGRFESRYAYDEHDGVPVLRSVEREGRYPGDRRTRRMIEVVERQFVPTPEAEFTLERLLDGPVVRHTASRRSAIRRLRISWDWYRLPLAVGAASLAGAAGMLGWSAFSRSRRIAYVAPGSRRASPRSSRGA